eukprot:TRINITY_DN977_c5_g1_i1.p1 TRINITY_DN977_c5_g1~~TRINITY_DN977_c5_g1_i1.p1  ORF type:complete len:670 (+),score=158.51 TRINITY_DN977_c5_g1_i1:49-2010(+)
MPSSKAKALKKQEEEAKRQEEMNKRAQDAADKLFRQHERERIQNEKCDKVKRENEQVMILLERDRLSKEKTLYTPIANEKQYRLHLALKEYQKYQDWENVVSQTWLPSVDSEADINSFLSTWETDGNAAREDSKRDLNTDFAMMAEAHDLIELILAEQDNARCKEATSKQPHPRIAFHRRNLMRIYEAVLTKLDEMTANMLQYLDKYVDRDEEQGITLCKENKALRYGLWAGDRRPRHRGVDYRELGVSMGPKEGAYLPKALDLVKERGIRVMQLNFDPMSPRIEEAQQGSQYRTLGCVVFIEVMQYPKLPQQVKEWTLRHETTLAKGLQRHPYPPLQATDNEAKPIKVSFVVPPTVVVRHLAPFIGIWSQDEETWVMQGTSDFDYKRDTRTVTFATQHLSCMAIIQEKGFDVPYEEWSLIPQSDSEVLFVIEGKRRGEISDREVQILIKDNKCRVVAPDEPELDRLCESWYSPATLLRHLCDSGYNFIFTDKDAEYFPDVLPKAKKMELQAYEDISNFCSVYAFASSKHNAARAGLQPGVTCEDPTLALFRTSREMRPESQDTPFKPDNEDTRWWTIRYGIGSCAITRCEETSDTADIRIPDGHESHLNLFMCRSADPEAAAEVHRRYDNGNLLLHTAVFELLCMTRPLSFG